MVDNSHLYGRSSYQPGTVRHLDEKLKRSTIHLVYDWEHLCGVEELWTVSMYRSCNSVSLPRIPLNSVLPGSVRTINSSTSPIKLSCNREAMVPNMLACTSLSK